MVVPPGEHLWMDLKRWSREGRISRERVQRYWLFLGFNKHGVPGAVCHRAGSIEVVTFQAEPPDLLLIPSLDEAMKYWRDRLSIEAHPIRFDDWRRFRKNQILSAVQSRETISKFYGKEAVK